MTTTEKATSIDMTPTWEEASRIFLVLLQDGDSTGKATARSEVQRMGKIIDAAQAYQRAAAAFPPTLTQIYDDGHEWLVVDPAQLAAVGLTEADISTCSYWNDNRIALEGDCDAAVFLTAYGKLFGHLPVITSEEESPRSWPKFGTKAFDPATFGQGIDPELLAKLANHTREA